MWRLSLPFWVNDLPQILQAKGFNPKWFDLWLSKCDLEINSFLHLSQANGFLPIIKKKIIKKGSKQLL